MYRVTMVVRDLVWFVGFKLAIPLNCLPYGQKWHSSYERMWNFKNKVNKKLSLTTMVTLYGHNCSKTWIHLQDGKLNTACIGYKAIF